MTSELDLTGQARKMGRNAGLKKDGTLDSVHSVGGTELDFPSQSYMEECVSKASKSFLVTVLNFRKNLKNNLEEE